MMEDTAISPDADPSTTILSKVCPTPGTKNGGTIPEADIVANMPEKPRTPVYAITKNGFLSPGLALAEIDPNAMIALVRWNREATNAPVFEMLIPTLGWVGKNPEMNDPVPQARAPVPIKIRVVDPVCR